MSEVDRGIDRRFANWEGVLVLKRHGVVASIVFQVGLCTLYFMDKE